MDKIKDKNQKAENAEWSERNWSPSDQGTSSPSSISTGAGTFSGTSYEDKASSPSTFTRDNMTGKVTSPLAAETSPTFGNSSTEEGKSQSPKTEGRTSANLSSIAGGRSRSVDSDKEGWSKTASRLGEKAHDVAGNLASKAQEMASKAQDVATDVAKKAQDAAGDVSDSLSTTVRRNPVSSLAVGFAAGCLLGLLIPRRR